MSLLVWLPLNGNLKSQGTTEINLINSGATVETNGKIGSCYYFNASAYLYENIYNWNNFNTSTFSICCWYKEPSPVASGNSQMITIGTNSGWNNIRIGVLRRTSTGYPLFTVSDGTSAIKYDCTATNFLFDTWNHIACTYNNGEIKIYLNGILDTTYTTTIVPVLDSSQHLGIGAASNGAEKLTGYLNDIRIYDHCLSAAEVHEISQGLVLHYKLDKLNNNILSSVPKAYDNTAYQAYQLSLVENLVGGQQYTFQFWDVNVSHSAKTEEQIGIGVYWGGGYNGLKTLLGTSYFPNGHADYISFTITAPTSPARPAEAENLWLCIYNSPGNASGTRNMSIGAWKVEKGNIATPWCYSANEGRNIIYDSSGYNNNTTLASVIQLSNDTPRYINSTLTEGTYGTMTLPLGTTQRNAEMTWCGWIKRNYDTSTAKVIFNGNVQIYLHTNFHIRITWNHATDSTTAANTWDPGITIPKDTWTHVAFTFKDGYLKCYINGEHKGNSDRMDTGQFIYGNRSNIFLSGNSTAGDTSQFIGQVSDIRLYVTELSAEDIKALYEVGTKIDNKSGIHSYEFKETTQTSITKTGIIEGSNFSEFGGLSYLKYDSNIYIEPDGSAWVHIFHHNNPTSNKFASTNTFTTGVYTDINRWFNFDLCNNTNQWEFLAKVKKTSDAALTKYRWIQTANPLTATFDQTKSANVTKITTTGYTSCTFGGLYHVSNSSWLAMNNGTNNNWFGAVGCWTAWNGGIPGWASTAAGDAITTGSIDIFIRIDNVILSALVNAKTTKNNLWIGNEFIEL